MTTVSFWCNKCRIDFDSEAEKYTVSVDNTQFWRTDCKKGHRCIRYITEPYYDPYFHESEKLKEMRYRFRKEILQPGQEGYNTLYGDPFKKLQDELIAKERKQWEDRHMIRGARVS